MPVLDVACEENRLLTRPFEVFMLGERPIGCFKRFGQRCQNELHTCGSHALQRSGSTSTQQIDDLRLELRHVVGPIAIDFPRAPAEGATGLRAPRMDRVMCSSEFVIATDMSGHGDLACGRLCTDYLAFALKGPN